jgi:hypothetical protein
VKARPAQMVLPDEVTHIDGVRVTSARRRPYELDLSSRRSCSPFEYNGGDHLEPARALRDLAREGHLAGAGRGSCASRRSRSTGVRTSWRGGSAASYGRPADPAGSTRIGSPTTLSASSVAGEAAPERSVPLGRISRAWSAASVTPLLQRQP